MLVECDEPSFGTGLTSLARTELESWLLEQDFVGLTVARQSFVLLLTCMAKGVSGAARRLQKEEREESQ